MTTTSGIRAVALGRIDSAVETKSGVPRSLSEAGVKHTTLTIGTAIIDNGCYDQVATERSPGDAMRDAPMLLAALKASGAAVASTGDFKQFDAGPTADRASPAYRDLLRFAHAGMARAAALQTPPFSTAPYSARVGGGVGFRVAIVTDRSATQILGFLGHDAAGHRIFVPREGERAQVWRSPG